MNRFRGLNVVWVGLFVASMGVVPLARPVWANDERVFEKTLASKQKVVVVRHELEGAAKEEEQQKHRDMVKGLPPGETSPMPDHFYLYLFQLAAADGKTNKEIWRMPWVELNEDPCKLSLFDASYEDASSTLIFVYKAHGGTFAEVMDTKSAKDPAHRKVPPMILRDQRDIIGVYVTSVVLGGSLAKGNWTASATNTFGEHYNFKWDGSKWKLTNFKQAPGETNSALIKQNLPYPEGWSF